MKVFRRVMLGAGILLLAVSIGYLAIRWSVRSNMTSTIREAERCLRQRDNARARETLKWLLWFEPTQHRALLIQGISLNADRRFLEAIQTFELIPENSDSFAEGEFALASSLIHDEQLDRAESVLRRHLQRFPGASAAREDFVRLNIRLLRTREAIAALMEYGKNGWEDFGALPLLLELQVKTMTPHEIVHSLEGTDRKHPGQVLVSVALARVYSLLGQTDQAQAAFEIALQLKPNDAVTRVLAAEFFLNLGDVVSAQRLLEADSIQQMQDDRLWFLRCRLAEHSGQVSEALGFLQDALRLRPNDESYVLMHSHLLRRLGQVEESRTAAMRATELAELRKRLLVLSQEFNRQQPDPDQCLEIADALEKWGQIEQATAWRQVRRLIAPNSQPESSETFK
jgi:tetratricopeptide (TPR) repeat protein